MTLRIRTILPGLTALLLSILLALPASAQDESPGAYLMAELSSAQAELDAKKEALAAAPDDAEAQAAVSSAREAVEAAVARLRAEIERLEATGDSEEADALRLHITETTGVVDLGDVSVGMLAKMVEKWTLKGKNWVVDELPKYVGKLIVFLIIYSVFKLLAGILARITTKALSTSKMNISTLLRDFTVSIVRKGTIFVGLVIALGSIGIDMGPILAGVGVLGFVIGFALQDTMGNFAAGVMLLLYRPFDVGDVISAAGVTGSVQALTLVSTKLTTPDNQSVIVPNGSIWGGVITNITANDTRRCDVPASIGYGDDMDKAEKILTEILEEHPLVLSDPAPAVVLSELAASSVDFVCRPWCKTGDYWTVKGDVTKAIKERFDAAGLSIPYPQQDVHLITEEPLAIKS